MTVSEFIKNKILTGVILNENENVKYNDSTRIMGAFLSMTPDFYDDFVEEDIKDDDNLYIGILIEINDDIEEINNLSKSLKSKANFHHTDRKNSEIIWFKITIDQLFQYTKVYMTTNYPEEDYINTCIQFIRLYKEKLTEKEIKEWVESFFIETMSE